LATARTARDWVDAAGSLADRNRLAAELHQRHGAPTHWRPVPPAERFSALARIIAYQQLSGSAAATIWSRVTGDTGRMDPDRVGMLGQEGLRAAGMSNAKARSLLDLAERFEQGTLELARCARWDDDTVVEHLTAARGVGPWSAQMFLIAVLGRTDVWPTGDVGVRNGWKLATGSPQPPDPDDLASAGEGFRPHRTVLAWWCWQEADTRLPDPV
jgi:DNA-3-methyladenine glycosylase II